MISVQKILTVSITTALMDATVIRDGVKLTVLIANRSINVMKELTPAMTSLTQNAMIFQAHPVSNVFVKKATELTTLTVFGTMTVRMDRLLVV